MKIFLLGYFGQDNFGDDAINRATMRFLIHEFGSDIDIYLCNQANHTINITGKFEENCEGMPKFRTHEVWFDSIFNDNYDLLVVCNSGFVYGFSTDVVVTAIEKGMPVRIYAMKQKRPNGKMGEIYDWILEKSDITIFRISSHYNSFNIKNDRIIDGVDLSYFTNSYDDLIQNNDVLIAPRYYNNNNNNLQISFINQIISSYPNINFKIMNCSKDDKKISDTINIRNNVEVLNFDYTDVKSYIKMIQSVNKIISLGRYHPLLFSLKYKKPSIYINTGYYSEHYILDKINFICSEYNIENISHNNFKGLEYINNNYNYNILEKKVKNTINAIKIDLKY